MEEFSLWNYQEIIDELKQKLMYTTLELEQLKLEASEEMRKNTEYVKQLLELLKMAHQERDEAKDRFQRLLNKIMPSSSPDFLASIPQIQSESRLLKLNKANSSITESNSLSDTYNYQSHGSSPVDSFFDAVSSPELSNINMADSGNIALMTQSLAQETNVTVANTLVPSGVPKIDRASMVIDNLIKGKPLPQKGNLLQAVLEAGPLLQTLLVAGPLPRWRNPPQLQPFHIPPVSIKGCDSVVVAQKSETNLSHLPSRSLNAQPYAEMSCASSQLSASMLNFSNGQFGFCTGSQRLISPGASTSTFVQQGKRQRFQ